MVDYTKWDKFAKEIEDEEGEGDEEEFDDGEELEEDQSVVRGKQGRPVVTRFDGPQSVTIPGRAAEQPVVVKEDDMKGVATSANEEGQAKRARHSPYHNGAICDRYYWSQDRTHVRVFFFVPRVTRGKDVRVNVDAGKRWLRIVFEEGGSMKTVVDEELAFSVEEESDGVMDWSLEDVPAGGDILCPDQRVIRVTLRKKAPHGTVLWCSNILKDESPIDISTIEGRNSSWTSASDVLQQATQVFKERVAQGKIGVELPVVSDQGQQQDDDV